MRLRTLKPSELETLRQWRLLIVEKTPFMAPILFSINYLATEDDRGVTTTITTSAINYALIINFQGIEAFVQDVGVSDQQRDSLSAALLLHAALHFLLYHKNRAEKMAAAAEDQAKWEIACDIEANQMVLIEFPVFRDASPALPEIFGWPSRLPAEKYFQLLQSLSSTQGDDPIASPEGQDDQYDEGCGSAVTNSSDSSLDDEARTLIEHSPTQNEVQDIMSRTLESGKSAGYIPADIESAVQIGRKSLVNWKAELRRKMILGIAKGVGSGSVSWRRPSKRLKVHTPQGKIFFPDRRRNNFINLTVIRDTSGSMTAQDLTIVNGEIKGIIDSLGVAKFSMTVVDFDQSAHGELVVSTNLDDLKIAKGGGGTDMMKAIKYAASLRTKPQLIVVITDGMNNPSHPWDANYHPPCPVIICLTPGPLTSTPRWAQVVRVRDNTDSR